MAFRLDAGLLTGFSIGFERWFFGHSDLDVGSPGLLDLSIGFLKDFRIVGLFKDFLDLVLTVWIWILVFDFRIWMLVLLDVWICRSVF